MVSLVILIHELSLALHAQNNIALLFYWFWLNTWNTQEVRATGFESLAIIEVEIEYFKWAFR